jgi:DNA-binding NarL/FixJ family response regulator
MKLLLVDDHGLFRSGLRLLLRALQRDLTILEASSCQEALDLLTTNLDIELCLIDLSLRGESGMQVITALKEINPKVITVIISGDERPSIIHAALDAGAMGYVPKSVSPEIMVSALQLVLAGGIYLPSVLIRPHHNNNVKVMPPEDNNALDLTERQTQVMQCLLRGWSNKLICRDLNISDNTLKGHLYAIYRNFGVGNRAQAVIEASKRGLKVENQGSA